jgi:hypothetical protein
MKDRRTMEKNLATVLAEVNPREPLASRLLTKSVSIHGPDMGQAPLTGRDTVAYRTVEQWVVRTAANNPQLLEKAVATATPGKLAGPPRSAPPSPPGVAGEKNWGSDREPPNAAGSLRIVSPSMPAAPISPTQASGSSLPPGGPIPATAPKSPDPVDPDGFNREFHPDPKEPAPTRQGQGNGQ